MGTKHVLRQLMQGFPILIVPNQPLIRDKEVNNSHLSNRHKCPQTMVDTPSGAFICASLFHALSHNVIHSVPRVGPRNHLLTGGNSQMKVLGYVNFKANAPLNQMKYFLKWQDMNPHFLRSFPFDVAWLYTCQTHVKNVVR